MKCPLDQTTLAISDRQGIEIDYCPECRGVWLDRGELDKLIDRADGGDRPSGSSPSRDHRAVQTEPAPRKKKPGSFLGDLFELGG